ncbi:MAG: ATP synthase F1 subunit epsilon [Bacillota bacterium]|nr:ATP synthase F1 subunit epsilon [Bacillota bacterium]
MANNLYLEIITPNKTFYSDYVETLTLTTPNGEMGVLSGHMPLVAAVSIGVIKIKKDGTWLEAYTSEGFMKIEHDKTIIFVDTAEWPEEIDENRALAAAERARERLQRQLSKVEYINSRAALQRAMSRLKVKSGRK